MGLVISEGLRLKSYNTPAAIAGVAPTLDYRFALDRREIEAISLTDKLTYTGATNGTFVNRAGLIERATTDQPRFDHGPVSRQSLGLLVEESRTNSITNNTMVGAVAGLPGTSPTGWFLTASANGISPEIVGTGVEDGIDYVGIRYSGTSTSSGNFSILASTVTAITAATGQSWTGSAYVKLQAGSFSGVTNTLQSLNGRSAAGASLESTNLSFTPNSDGLGVQRRTVSRTLANASTVRVSHTIFNCAYASGATIDLTLRIGLPQLELGAFATSVIPTTTTALTRPVDSAVIDGTGVITGTYTLVEKPAGCAVVNGTNIDLVSGFTAERVMVFPAALSAPQITAIRGAM
jgi:hypothetical protein